MVSTMSLPLYTWGNAVYAWQFQAEVIFDGMCKASDSSRWQVSHLDVMC